MFGCTVTSMFLPNVLDKRILRLAGLKTRALCKFMSRSNRTDRLMSAASFPSSHTLVPSTTEDAAHVLAYRV